MSNELINKIITAASIGEDDDWEFKSALGGFPGSFWETYSAFANSDGGIVVLGARENENDIKLDGLTSEQLGTYQKTLWDGLNNRGKVSRNLLSSADVQIVKIVESSLLTIRVPRAERGVRPIYLGQTPFGNTYRRQHEGDYRCSDDEVRRLLADADPTPVDQKILTGFTINDLDHQSITQYRQRFLAVKGEHAWLSLDDREFLERLGGWRRDRTTNTEGVTLAGLLMFGKDSAVRDPEGAPSYFVDYREKLDPTIRWVDRVYPDGSWESNLFQFYQRVWPKLSAGLPVPFHLESGVRRDETPAHEALREAFVNALIHADYTAPGGVVLERYPEKFVFENPGTLLVSLEQLRSGGVSECRNKSIQRMFLMIGGGEQAGSGVDKIRTGWRSRHWRPPLLKISSQPDRIRVTLPMVSLIPEATLAHLHKLFGRRIDSLNPNELQALATAEIEGAVTNTRLQELLEVHPVDITRLLQYLCENNYLVSDNRRRWSRYRLFVPEADGTMELLRSIAAPIASNVGASGGDVWRVILKLCEGRALTIGTLSELLNRNTESLRDQYLMPMVRESVLRMKYQDEPYRVDQTFTANIKSV